MSASENQIVVYQPDETMRLDVRLENETVWLTQSQMATLFGCSPDNVGLHLRNIYARGELDRSATTEECSAVQMEGHRRVRRNVCFYNLDAIISVGYRVNSILGVKFRQWATRVLKEYLLRGHAVNQRVALLEDKVDRRLAKTEADVADLKEKVDFFVQTRTPPLQGVFYEGQLWDAREMVLKLVAGAKRSIVLIDNWATADVLDLFAKKRPGVKVTVITSEHFNKNHVPSRKISEADVKAFNAQYPKLSVRYNESFHDRFLVIDDRELYLVGASLKDLGRKCFGFTRMDTGEILRIRKAAFAIRPKMRM